MQGPCECLHRVSRDRTARMAAPLRLVSLVLAVGVLQAAAQSLLDSAEFTPTVTATCKAGRMTIRVHTNGSFYGAVHARDFRTANCIALGNGSTLTTLDINLVASNGAPDYCGVLVNNKSEERSVPVAVRVHRTLELHDDKFYVITCGKAGFRNSRNETSHVSLKLVDKGRRVSEVVYSHPYTLRADVTRPDGTHGIRVKNCFAFNKLNSSVNLIDERGCPFKSSVISPFKYDPSSSSAEAELRSMFRFPDSSQLHFQCDIALCRGACPEPSCADDDFQLQQAGLGGLGLTAQSRALDQDSLQAEEGALMASTSVFVLEPGEAPLVAELCDGGVHPPWLLWLCIALGVLFLIMLIINCFLCSAMTCSCARTEVIEKEPSIIEDYDPYRSWHGSQYGSRYSLNGKPGYTSGGSTMNSTRSVSTNSDHYAIVHSRPGSRYSHKNQRDRERDRDGRDHRDRGPPSHIGSHYSGKM